MAIESIKLTVELEMRVQKAVEYFMAGYGCGQSVVAAFADMYSLDESTALNIGNGFGGGVGKMRMMCGAVSGMVILAGLENGKSGEKIANVPTSDSIHTISMNTFAISSEKIRATKDDCYRLVQDLLAAFKDANGSIICAELLGMAGCSTAVSPNDATPSGHTPSERNAEYYKARPCAAKVESAARLFANYLATTR